MTKKQFAPLAILSIGALLAACGNNAENAENNGNNNPENNNEASEQTDELTIGVTPWTSTIPPTYIAKNIFEDMGYDVELIEADVSTIFIGLADDDIDVYMDSWMPVHENYYEEYNDDITNIATSYPSADSGLAVPEYMDDVETIEDLKGMEDEFDNSLYGIEEGASVMDELRDLIDEYELDMELVASSEGGMISQAQRNMANEDPVVFYGWRPHSMFNELDIKLLDDPDEFFDEASVHVMIDNDIEQTAPDAFAFLENWSIDIDDVEEMIVQIEDDADEADVAAEWIEENQERVDDMRGE
ncbi:glycine betaine ABC transporter substrate-binding protein [Salisediminibacterium halotolerans]|uniref:Glycine betaine/proline transport system substrate-binding protein n=1 Tax=Salisediminibacterium halotolerans TaxID=517425 RepID=A0A1H9R5S5_9BACI|nr:glycine betaine ABC transporter substrate-binding protein [Salisediminibacterium haloalkalitolerans]SER68048.1 glycine betaine/proline transport system substrate-binding protein [Salisediminibacterium haloalkalitolerans]